MSGVPRALTDHDAGRFGYQIVIISDDRCAVHHFLAW